LRIPVWAATSIMRWSGSIAKMNSRATVGLPVSVLLCVWYPCLVR
jgi:hypothetical protein